MLGFNCFVGQRSNVYKSVLLGDTKIGKDCEKTTWSSSHLNLNLLLDLEIESYSTAKYFDVSQKYTSPTALIL